MSAHAPDQTYSMAMAGQIISHDDMSTSFIEIGN